MEGRFSSRWAAVALLLAAAVAAAAAVSVDAAREAALSPSGSVPAATRPAFVAAEFLEVDEREVVRPVAPLKRMVPAVSSRTLELSGERAFSGVRFAEARGGTDPATSGQDNSTAAAPRNETAPAPAPAREAPNDTTTSQPAPVTNTTSSSSPSSPAAAPNSTESSPTAPAAAPSSTESSNTSTGGAAPPATTSSTTTTSTTSTTTTTTTGSGSTNTGAAAPAAPAQPPPQSHYVEAQEEAFANQPTVFCSSPGHCSNQMQRKWTTALGREKFASVFQPPDTEVLKHAQHPSVDSRLLVEKQPGEPTTKHVVGTIDKPVVATIDKGPGEVPPPKFGFNPDVSCLETDSC